MEIAGSTTDGTAVPEMNTCSPFEAELRSILAVSEHLALCANTPQMACVLTDPNDVMQELWKAYSGHPTANIVAYSNTFFAKWCKYSRNR